jgi:N-acetylglucosaminyldiphosphoundecaprenol N-acetyl-beta-D-mannosaminyltransferase
MATIQGIDIDHLTVPQLLNRVGALIEANSWATVGYVNVHVLNIASHNSILTTFLQNLDLCYCDGSGVVLASHILGEPLPQRMTGIDWIEDLAAKSATAGWKMAWIGGMEGVAAEASRRLISRHRGLQIPFTAHGYTPPGQEVLELISRLNAAQPDIVLVGMGTPLQEMWVMKHRRQIDAPLVWCLGATADVVSGKVDRGPSWLYRHQEWLARLLVDPRRLWRRYLIGNPRFLLRVLRQRRGRR